MFNRRRTPASQNANFIANFEFFEFGHRSTRLPHDVALSGPPARIEGTAAPRAPCARTHTARPPTTSPGFAAPESATRQVSDRIRDPCDCHHGEQQTRPQLAKELQRGDGTDQHQEAASQQNKPGWTRTLMQPPGDHQPPE